MDRTRSIYGNPIPHRRNTMNTLLTERNEDKMSDRPKLMDDS